MKKGFLSEYFEGVVAKRLSAVEANPGKSNQHEFNGVMALKQLLGEKNCLIVLRGLYGWAKKMKAFLKTPMSHGTTHAKIIKHARNIASIFERIRLWNWPVKATFSL